MRDHHCEPSRYDPSRCRHCAAQLPLHPAHVVVTGPLHMTGIDRERPCPCEYPASCACRCHWSQGELMEAWGK
jgi:hypothetical protein